MLTLILLFVITINCFVVLAILDKHYEADSVWGVLSGVIGVMTLLCGIGFACSLININNRFEATINEYEAICQMVDSYQGQDYGNMAALTESIVHMNKTISVHKAHYNSPWMGLWYSERVANLELIQFNRNVPRRE